MSFIEILIIGFALSLDAFATMMANSSAYQSKSKGFNLFAVFTIAFLHAFFCVVGYLCAFYTVFLSEEICSYFVACIFLLMSVSALYSAITTTLLWRITSRSWAASPSPSTCASKAPWTATVTARPRSKPWPA